MNRLNVWAAFIVQIASTRTRSVWGYDYFFNILSCSLNLMVCSHEVQLKKRWFPFNKKNRFNEEWGICLWNSAYSDYDDHHMEFSLGLSEVPNVQVMLVNCQIVKWYLFASCVQILSLQSLTCPRAIYVIWCGSLDLCCQTLWRMRLFW